MRRGPLRIWTLSLRPTSIAIALVVAVVLGGSAVAITLGERNADRRREAARIQMRLDSLLGVSDILAHQLLVRDALVFASRGRLPAQHASLLAEEIERNAQLYHFDPLLILAVVLTESQGQFDAVGKLSSGTASGARGVMQLQPGTARATALRLGMASPDDAQLMDPTFNLTVGVAYLLMMVHRYGDLRLGIMAYNVGASGLESGLRGESTLPEEYYRKVYTKYQSLLASRQPPG